MSPENYSTIRFSAYRTPHYVFGSNIIYCYPQLFAHRNTDGNLDRNFRDKGATTLFRQLMRIVAHGG